MRRLFVVLILVLNFGVIVFPQKRKVENVRLDKTKPSVYLSFVRLGKLEPWVEDLSGEYVFLRLHNNTRWKIYFEASGVSGDEFGEASLYYKIVRYNRNKAEDEIVPGDTQYCSACSIIPLDSGKSLLFSVPREYLADEKRIEVYFNFEWQDENEVRARRGVDSFVKFYGDDILTNSSKK